jgi:hypothetical protein
MLGLGVCGVVHRFFGDKEDHPGGCLQPIDSLVVDFTATRLVRSPSCRRCQ